MGQVQDRYKAQLCKPVNGMEGGGPMRGGGKDGCLYDCTGRSLSFRLREDEARGA